MKEPKYRPSLTAREIEHIVELAKTESPISSLSLAVLVKLTPFLAKIEIGSINPAHIPSTKPAVNSLESLGAAMPELGEAAGKLMSLTIDNFSSKQDLWEACYNKSVSNPATCSVTELECAREHRYLNDMMSEQEVIDFEREEFVGKNQ